MSTNTSQNLGLHLWEPTDQVLRTEFNQNWQKIDTAVNTAQGTAEAAQDTADAAYCSTNKPFVAGSYVGNGSAVTVALGFQPSFLVISGSVSQYPLGVEDLGAYDAFTAGSILTDIVTMTETGFTARTTADNVYPQLANSGKTYNYIAFR